MSTIRRLVTDAISTSVAAAVVTAERAVRGGRELAAGVRYGATS